MLLPLLLSVVSLTLAANYSDPVARDDMLSLSAGAYSEDPQKCLTSTFGDGNLKRQLNVKCDFFISDTCSGYTAVIPSQKAVVVAFRGTNAFFQLVEEGTKSAFKEKMDWIAGGKVSKYFGDAFMRLWDQGMKDDFLTLLNKYPGYEVWVTGHSLGGALATLAASYILSTELTTPNNIKLVTFGEPRVGNKDFASAHDGQMDYAFRVTHWRDIVPHVPPEDFEGYYHARTEVFYKEKMKPTDYKVCAQDEDKNCSDGLLVTASIDEHLHYFGKDINVWGAHGCKK